MYKDNKKAARIYYASSFNRTRTEHRHNSVHIFEFL